MVEILREFFILLRVLQNIGFSVHLAVFKTDRIMVIASIYSITVEEKEHISLLKEWFYFKKFYA